jgi:hypothetical protein
MSDSETFTSYKHKLDSKLQAHLQGPIEINKQIDMPKSAGSRGLKTSQQFMKDRVHLMGEDTALSIYETLCKIDDKNLPKKIK